MEVKCCGSKKWRTRRARRLPTKDSLDLIIRYIQRIPQIQRLVKGAKVSTTLSTHNIYVHMLTRQPNNPPNNLPTLT